MNNMRAVDRTARHFLVDYSLPLAATKIANVAAWLPGSAASQWVRGPIWDSFWMLNALWLAPIVLWLAHGYSDPESSPLDLLYFALTTLFWIGHRLCSTYLAYCTEAYRPLLRTQPIRFVVIPVLVTLSCFAIFLPGDSALPWTREERLIGLAIVDYAWVTFHFAAQHFGALALYRSRAGRAGWVQTRRLDRFFAISIGGVLVFLADILAGAVAYQDQWIDRWPFVQWIVSAQDPIRIVGTCALILVTAIMLVAELRSRKWSLPRVLYILGIAIMVGIALQPRSLFLFLVVWTSQHWIVATGLASQTPGAEPAPKSGNLRRALHQLNIRPWAILLFLTALSIFLLPLFEVEANRETGTYYGDRIFGALATQLRMPEPEVRAAAAGLLKQRNNI